jgi:2EXR family
MQSTQDALNIHIPPPKYTPTPQPDDDGKDFHLFSIFPAEIRMRVWEASLAPRIVRWIRMTEGSVFTAPSGSLPLLSVCQESRIAAFLYGAYRVLTASSKVYFSPVVDYLWLDPGWIHSHALGTIIQDDPLDSMRHQFGELRNIMVHPNWSGERKVPTVSLASVPSIRQILVAAEEKSIGIRSSVMLETMQDLKYYYYGCRKQKMAIRIPYIAVACLGWTGPERKSPWHGSEDKRQLLTVFENVTEMKAHLAYLREEEWTFTQQQRVIQPRIVHRLRQVLNRDEEEPAMEAARSEL